MRFLCLAACTGYWALLTVLLLVPDPAAVIGLQTRPTFPWGDFGIHMAFFTVLGLLVQGTRWPRSPAWFILGILTAYGIATESLQVFVPHRHACVMDAIQNVSGVAIGSALYWLVHRKLIGPVAEPHLAVELAKSFER